MPGETGAAEQFALAHGYRVANRESLTQLLMSDYTARRDLVMERIGDRTTDYRIVTFDTTCPEQHLRSFGRLLGMSHSEVPLGELDLPDSEWTPERLRAAEERCVDIGGHVLTGLAIAPDGSVAGSSDVRINDADPSLGQVGLTLVDPAHRGHRLGLALEIATHDLAMAACPACVSFDTWNADANTHMNSVNESLGYRSIEILVELQKVL